MPIYEYRCTDCKRRFSVFWRTYADAESGEPVCSRCGSANVSRLVSRVRIVRSEESHFESLSDPNSLPDFDESDPQSLGRWMRKVENEMGEDMGDEFHEVVGRLEAGEDPAAIEQSIPDLAGDSGGNE